MLWFVILILFIVNEWLSSTGREDMMQALVNPYFLRCTLPALSLLSLYASVHDLIEVNERISVNLFQNCSV